MYTDFYGLRELPFSLTPDPRFLYFTPSHKEVLANLRYGITNGKGLIVVTGEVGTGKTTIVRWMLEHFDRTVLVAYIFNPRLTVNEFYQHMAQLLNIQNWSSKADLMVELGRTLEARQARGLRTVLIVDEAQGLAPFVLEEIRLLMNFESNTAKYLQIILTGQPELREVLNTPELRQLKQRIALRSEIKALPNAGETESYITERLRMAGATQPNIFSPEAIDFIYRCSEGIPRQVNNLCDNAMLLGYGAELPIIGRKVIEEVAETFDMLPRKERSVLEAELDNPPIFTREARARLHEEKVDLPQPRPINGHKDSGNVLDITANRTSEPKLEVASNGSAAPATPAPNGNGSVRVPYLTPPANGSMPSVKPASASNGALPTPKPVPAGNGAVPTLKPPPASNGAEHARQPMIRPPQAPPANGTAASRPDPNGVGTIRPSQAQNGNGALPAAPPAPPVVRLRERVGKRN